MNDPRSCSYIYQHRRPRPSNPSYNSSGVGKACFSLYQGGPLQQSPSLQPSQNQPSLREEFKRSRAHSQLSNFGSAVLNTNDKDVYGLQKSKPDIINLQPVWNQESIKNYPQYTLQDKQAYYFRRMSPKGQIPSLLPSSGSRYQPDLLSIRSKNHSIAGVHTHRTDPNKIQLDLWQSYQGKRPLAPKFCAKMLNHADDFRSLM